MINSYYHDKPQVLVVDDDEGVLKSLNTFLKASFRPTCVSTAKAALESMNDKTFQAVLADITLQGMDGVTLLSEIKKSWPLTEVIMITADSSMEQAVHCLKKGAFDYITKPFDLKHLAKTLQNAAQKSDLARKVAITQAKAGDGIATMEITSPSSLPKIKPVKDALALAAKAIYASMPAKDKSRNRFILRASLHELERDVIILALAKRDWNQSEVALFLNTPRITLMRKMKKFKIPTAKQPTNFK